MMNNPLLKKFRIGFFGAGNMAQAMIKGIVEAGIVPANHIYCSNRSVGKLIKLKDQFGINVCETNEDLVENSDIVFLAMKPQDLIAAIDPMASIFNEKQIVVSLAAGVRMATLEKHLPQCRLVRAMPNTPTIIGKGVIGYLMNEEDDDGLSDIVESLFSPLGYVLEVDEEDHFEALTVSCASGTGFVFEMMLYWQDWIQEHGFTPEEARRMTIETFVGASLLASQTKDVPIEDLQNRVSSKKGVTVAGLESMRELEIERALRISFEKAAMRNQEMARGFK